MEKYICTVCGFVYDEAQGIPDAAFRLVPNGKTCRKTGYVRFAATKDEFEQEESAPAAPVVEKKAASDVASTENVRELTPLEISALCTNLARGCEKQYKPAEAESFMTLAAFFKSAAPSAQDPAFDQLLTRIEEDLTEGFQCKRNG